MMEGSNKDKTFSSNYEEDNEDSDIESRLYAEIHYTNSIIGDESNSVQNLSNNDLGKKSTGEHHSAIPELQSGVLNTSAQKDTMDSIITNSVNENSVPLQSNVNSNSKKRPLTTNSHQGESKNKKKKQKNKNDNVNENNRIINPYHKDVVNNQQYGMKLLSPDFLNLFFGKSKNKKKKAAQKKSNPPVQPSKVSVPHDTPVLNISQENVLQSSSENQVVQNETEVSGTQDLETIIDICSESSNDSTEDNSKYDNIEATDKKLTKQNSVVNNENSDDDTSDSSESIYEVPVPPKPAPPVIELNDSDNENVERNDNSASSGSSSSDDSDQENSQNIERSITNVTENLPEQENSSSESSEPDNLILNCTEIQKGASNISEIKRMSHEISSKTSENETNIVNALDSSQTEIDILSCSMSREKEASPVKEINSSVTKQVRKSARVRDKQNISKEKSFFQPMSDKMKSFYNDSWGGENFDLEKLKSKMPRDPKRWAILDDDLIVSFSRRKRYFGMVCSRCQKDGHRQNQCPEPYKLPTCHMCGLKGHFETGCPEKKCLTCGKKQNSYRKTCEQCIRMICTRCKARGHMEHFCPDLWRSYHQTINNTKPNVPKNVKTVMKPQQSLYCCNCAKRGHDSENCRKLRWSEHFPVPSRVISYDGPEYSEENVSPGSLNNSNSFCENSLTPSNSSDKTVPTNLAHNKVTSSPRNPILDADKSVIFKIKSKGIESDNSSKANFNLNIPNLNTPNSSEPSRYNYWNGLSTFLFELVEETPGEFLLRQNNKKVVMEMRVSRSVRVNIEKLIQQYAERNNFERSYMYLKCDRNPKKFIEHLEKKFNEINNVTTSKDVLELYEELISLKSLANEQPQANVNRSMHFEKLIICQKELLAALYREGCANDSLKRLKKLYDRIRKKVYRSSKKSKKLKPAKHGALSYPKIAIRTFLECLYQYNSVFVPHEPRQLNRYIGEYKRLLEQRERLKNNPLIFPQGPNTEYDKSNAQNNSFNSTVTTENVLTSSSSSSQIPSLLLINTSTVSQIDPSISLMQPMNSLVQPAISSNTCRPLLSINTSISSNFDFSQKLPAVANNVETVSNKKDLKTDSYNRFLKQTKKLIEKARHSDVPNVRKHVQILENKLKNGIYLYKKDVQMLKVLVNKHR